MQTPAHTSAHHSASGVDILESLRDHRPTVWTRPPDLQWPSTPAVTSEDLANARARMQRFIPALQRVFSEPGWDGRFVSGLRFCPALAAEGTTLLLKADHELPLTGTIKARGGIYELLCRIETICFEARLLQPEECYSKLAEPSIREALARHTVSVASTGNLGYSVGLVASAFGLNCQVHMSIDAKPWKKDRLRALGATVIEHNCDYTRTVANARQSALETRAIFIDDEASRDLLIGYALAADETLDQLAELGITPTEDRPLVVYLPCGVGGAPGGITFGLKARLGSTVHCVFVEPAASACFMLSLAVGNGKPVSVYGSGLDNRTIADGLAVPVASKLVLDALGNDIDGAVALGDPELLRWVRKAWSDGGLRLEPSAASALAAIGPYMAARPDLRNAWHVAWLTGGSRLPDEEFQTLLG